MMKLLTATALLSAATVVGCASSRSSMSEVSAPATQPSNVAVTAPDFDQLWTAADDVARELLFVPDRQDRRAGTFRTEPMTSAQWFEPWRRELRTSDAVVQSSLATIRRTLTVQIVREPDGTFLAKPSVLVERYVQAERRITSSARYRQLYGASRTRAYGTPETDAGILLPNQYWYPIGNDPYLERFIARKMNGRLKS